MKIYLIRHAEEGEGGHLSERGKHQALKLREWLKTRGIRAVFSSDRPRAEETAEIATAKLNLKNTIIPNFEEVRELNINETDEQVLKRIRQGLRFALEKNTNQDIAIIAHSKLIRRLLDILHLRPYHEDDPDLPNTGVVTLDYRDGKYRLLG